MGEERRSSRPQVEDAVLDIGGEVGAVLLYTDASYRDSEVEISPLSSEGARTHTAVHERIVDGNVVYAGLFPALRAGAYRLWTDDSTLPDHVVVSGGEVTVVDWRR